ncbi:O-antigen ligase family protein [Methyloversatilis discipulorum]|uniref:O-antigen ligase family protein n=1 Tax=Methyloversatilis discipulorum TaxID=1119528 RepID=UPI001A5A7EA6|nr:O-antigen ligase family protein [Methyloversatilis discipulorum]MBL8468073.1 O-antigen ligase family protein [Methyloversatilis discipulorum]
MHEEQDGCGYLILSCEVKKLPLVGSFFFLFSVSPLLDGLGSPIPAHDLARLAQLVLFLALVFYLPPPSRIALSVVAGEFLFVAAIHSNAGRWAWIEALHLAVMIVVADGLRQSLGTGSAKRISALTAMAVAVYLCLGLLPRWTSLLFAHVAFVPHEFFPGFSNARFFGHWVTISLPVLVAASCEASTRRFAFLTAVIASLWVSFGLASGTRGTWVSVIAMCGLLAMCGNVGRRQLYRTLAVLAAGGVLYAVMFHGLVASPAQDVSVAGRLTKSNPLSGRSELWSDALFGILRAPLSGHGPMSFADSVSRIAAHPHNSLLQLCFEWGIPLAFVVVAVFSWKLSAGVRKAMRRGMHVELALCIALFGAVVHSMVDGVLVMPHGQAWFLLFCGFLLSLTDPDSSAGTLQTHDTRLRHGMSLACAAALCVLIAPELQNLTRWEDSSLASTEGGRFLPRFWIQGVVP